MSARATLIAAAAGLAASAALAQLAVFGLLAIPLLPLCFVVACRACWRLRGPGRAVWPGAVVLLGSVAFLTVAAVWAAALAHAAALAGARPALAPPGTHEWVAVLALWLLGSVAAGFGMTAWTALPRRGALSLALQLSCLVPAAVVVLFLLGRGLPISA